MSRRKRRSDRSGRAPLRSPGRPPVAGRDERRRFWAAIAAGHVERGCCGRGRRVAGCRHTMVPGGWRHAASDVRASAKPLVRAISVVRGAGGDRAAACAGLLHAGDRASARPGGVDDLAGVAAQRCHPERRSGVSCDDGAVACRAIGPSPEAGEACAQRGIARLCAGTTGRRGRRAQRRFRSRPGGRLERTSAWTAAGSAVGAAPGARSRSLAACRSTSRMMGRCASVTKPSTRRCSSKAAERCAAS